MSDATPSTELVITRTFDAPRALVYQAFIDPDQLTQWFAPGGWSVPRDTIDIDPRVGGHERFVMVSDEDPSQRAPVDAIFTEVVENELLVCEEEYEGVPLRLRLEFHDEGDNKTRLVLRQGPYTEDALGGAQEGWGGSLTKLDALLAR
jgi:uncharacterized protein YndB with AHSA1/START domain